MANITLSKLLQGGPLYIDKWIQFIDAFQNMLLQFRLDKSEKLSNRRSLDTSDIDDVTDFIKSTGFRLPSLTGYTASDIYKRLRAKSIIAELRKKYSETAFKSIYRSFNVFGDVFQCQKLTDTDFRTVSSDFIEGHINYLDQEMDMVQYYVGPTPVPNPPPASNMPPIFLDMEPGDLPVNQEFLTLDSDMFVAQTNHLVLQYRWILSESLTQLWSPDTAFGIYETMRQMKKINVVYLYEPYIQIDLSSAHTLSLRQIPVYDNYSSLAQIKGILIGADLSTVTKLKIGNGSHTVIDLSLTDLASPLQSYTLPSTLRTWSLSASYLFMETAYGEYSKLTSYTNNQILMVSEMGLFDASDNLIAYITFPEINFDSRMLSNIAIEVNVI